MMAVAVLPKRETAQQRTCEQCGGGSLEVYVQANGAVTLWCPACRRWVPVRRRQQTRPRG